MIPRAATANGARYWAPTVLDHRAADHRCSYPCTSERHWAGRWVGVVADSGWSVARAVDGSVVVGLRGDIDVDVDGDLVTIARLVSAEQPANVAIDLSEVDFMASWGVGFLQRVRALAAQHGRTVAIYGASPRIVRLLYLVGLTGYLPVVEGAPPAVRVPSREDEPSRASVEQWDL